ncbi:acylphosphatase-like [hydrocarbon metagenome]|uniref:Acylphosphatase-like n=1 Tax=hydrocarbon metagenome TaxID=938273 RepID=A0A0W8F2F8_9ZZZZ
MKKRVVARISGSVQGVGFRDIVADYAYQDGITGTVENIDEGDVRIIAEGEEEALKRFITRIGDTRDRYVHVHEIAATWGAATGESPYFRIIHGDLASESFERMGIGITILKNISGKQDQMIGKQDQMIGKQDQMIELQKTMLDSGNRTRAEIQGFREDFRTMMNREFSTMKEELQEIKAALRKAGIMG